MELEISKKQIEQIIKTYYQVHKSKEAEVACKVTKGCEGIFERPCADVTFIVSSATTICGESIKEETPLPKKEVEAILATMLSEKGYSLDSIHYNAGLTTGDFFDRGTKPYFNGITANVTKKKEKSLIKNLEIYEEMLIVVDMVNGFARGDGMLVSPLVEAIIPNVVSYVEEARKENRLVIFIKDTHDKDSIEFKRFGNQPHCLRGTTESQLVDELIPYEEDAISFEKNSTSFMFAKNPNFKYKYGFMEMLDGLKNLKKVKVCGCCTDICDTNGVLPMMNYFDEDNRDIEVELLEDAMATYDAPWHRKDKYTDAAYLLLEQQGAKRVKKLGGK